MHRGTGAGTTTDMDTATDVQSVRLRRGTPIDVRPNKYEPWRPWVAATDTLFRLDERETYNGTRHWVFAKGEWQVRVAVPLLERVAPAGTWHFGITASRKGATEAQKEAVRAHLGVWLVYALGGLPTVHHGGEAHGDRGVHNLVREAYGGLARIVIHPASDQPSNLCDWTDGDEVREPAPSLVRNGHIVDSLSQGAVLIALPGGMVEERRSGTWATVRSARRQGKAVVLFWPDGTVGRRDR